MRLLAALPLLLLSPRADAQEALFADGFEPTCYGTANDRPGCLVVPYQQPPLTPSYTAHATAAWNRVDLYVLLGRTGSMVGETSNVRDNLATVGAHLKCAPDGTGVRPGCIESFWSGAGTYGYAGINGDMYNHYIDVQPNPSFAAIPVTQASTCCTEAQRFGMYLALNPNNGSVCSNTLIPARTSCAGSPAGASGFGHACFRPEAVPLVAVVTDDTGSTCPNWPAMVNPQFYVRGAFLLGFTGSGAAAAVGTELADFTTNTGAVDRTNSDAPLVFPAPDAAASSAIESGVRTFLRGAPMDVHAEFVDDPSDPVDTRDLLDVVEVVNDGSGGCPNGAGTSDPSTFTDIVPGTVLCFRVVPRFNMTVPPMGPDRVYPAKLRLLARRGHMLMGEVALYFAVPP